MNTQSKHILLVDDDFRLCAMLAEVLQAEGFKVQSVHTGQGGLDVLNRKTFDLMILDWMLPDINGLECCKRLRADGNQIPIIMLTAKGDDVDKIVGLEMGADDYLPKPFNTRELVARVNALLRRTQMPQSSVEKLELGMVIVDGAARQIIVDNQVLELTSHQFELFRVLAERAGRAQTRQAIADALDGYAYPGDRSIDVHISRIRQAIMDVGGDPQWIRAVRGVGYMMVSEPK